jgi:hypothetical protein
VATALIWELSRQMGKEAKKFNFERANDDSALRK